MFHSIAMGVGLGDVRSTLDVSEADLGSCSSPSGAGLDDLGSPFIASGYSLFLSQSCNASSPSSWMALVT